MLITHRNEIHTEFCLFMKHHSLVGLHTAYIPYETQVDTASLSRLMKQKSWKAATHNTGYQQL